MSRETRRRANRLNQQAINQDVAHGQGSAAGLAGGPLDSCPYRRADLRNYWIRGWHEGRELAERYAAPAPTLTDEGRAALAAIRKMLEQKG
ncbi:Ribosome modulation factor [Methylomagnum ishizawai]|uniref:Ribosome modulation factor n=1 Tax=Methylomagnum ishizawai TaxID=1760988 RepID=A0A1Y6CVH0_9GAMM|nr:ribosome modulation factor [Methylomagnum ishizawai]SMF94327.1 Ribosome modulation factor [Methylomagnum ishizawai]